MFYDELENEEEVMQEEEGAELEEETLTETFDESDDDEYFLPEAPEPFRDDLNDENDFYKQTPQHPMQKESQRQPRVKRQPKRQPGKRNLDRINPADPRQADYIKPGSKAHAQLLGLIPATKKTKKDRKEAGLEVYDWELEDITKYGLTATERFLEAVLKQKISELTTPQVMPQTTHVHKPGFTKPLWIPVDVVDEHGNPVVPEVKGYV